MLRVSPEVTPARFPLQCLLKIETSLADGGLGDSGCILCYPSTLWCDRHEAQGGPTQRMAEKTVLIGVIPEASVIGPADQVAWTAGEGQLKIEFDPNRCPFSSNLFQAPAGMRLLSGPPRPGTKPGSFKYRVWLNDQLVGSGEVILREK